MLGGCLALAAGAGVTIAAIETGTAAVLLLGTGIAGLGYGPAFTGAYRTVVALAPEDDRAGLIAAIFTVSYLSSGVPALIAGITAEQYGLHGTALVYSAAVAGLAAAAGTFLTRHGSRTGKPHIQQLLPHPPGPCTMPRRGPVPGEQAEDLGDQRGVGGAVLGLAFQQGRHRVQQEPQQRAVGLGQVQGALQGPAGCALVLPFLPRLRGPARRAQCR